MSEDKIVRVSAPGRTEICGNHTDHQNGKVLAAAINLEIEASVEKPDIMSQDKDIVRMASEGIMIPDIDVTDLKMRQDEKGTSAGLIRGVLYYLKMKGFIIGGFSATTVSKVLQGSGLSSSAAFETLIGRIISKLYNGDVIDPLTIAEAGHFAENEYFGKPCGLMDQCACSFGGIVSIDFKDTKKPEVERVYTPSEGSKSPIEKMGLKLCIVDTGGNHADLTDDYAAIREEMVRVAGFFGKEVLREVNEDEFYAALGGLSSFSNTYGDQVASIYDYCSDRALLRAIHFFNEEKRVDSAVKALKEANKEEFLKNIKLSGESSFKYLQNVYSPAHPEIQKVSKCLALSEMILGDKGVARVHGGGFAGTVQVFVNEDFADNYKLEIERYFGNDSCKILNII